MHIALVTPGWPPESCPNGIVTYVAHMRTELLKQGHRVSVFANALRGDASTSGVYAIRSNRQRRLSQKLLRWSRVPPPMGWGEAIVDSILRVHATDAIDIVEMEESFGWCATVQARLPIPVVIKLHGPAHQSLVDEDSGTPQALLRIRAEGEALAQARFVTTPSAATLKAACAFYGLPVREPHVLVNPVGVPGSLPMWDVEHATPKQLLFVGRFDKRKGGDFLVRAFARLLEHDPQVRLVFVGPDIGVKEEGRPPLHFETYVEQLANPHLRAAIDFRGPLPHDEIAPLRTRSAATLICSRWDNQPNTALEAMLQGCPVVSTDGGSMPEIVTHEKTGLLYRAGDMNDFCAQVMRVLSEPSLSAALGAAARQHVLGIHAPAIAVSRTVALYRHFIDVHRSTPAKAGDRFFRLPRVFR